MNAVKSEKGNVTHNNKSKYKEVRATYFSKEEKCFYIDAWKTDNSSEEGTVIAKVYIGNPDPKVRYIDETARMYENVRITINKAAEKLHNMNVKNNIHEKLQTFIDDFNVEYKKDNKLPHKLITSLIKSGRHYKFISTSDDNVTPSHRFCIKLQDALNKGVISQIQAFLNTNPELLPTRLVSLKFKPHGDDTVEMFLDNGWELNFNINNATPQSKDIELYAQLIGVPVL